MKAYKKVITDMLLVLIICLFLLPSSGYSLCKTSFVNFITEIGWVNLFPLKIGGITVFDSDQPDVTDHGSSPVCLCIEGGKPIIGVVVSFWEPYRFIDAVVDPGCLPLLGMNLFDSITSAVEAGQGGVKQEVRKSANSHYYAWGHVIIAPLLVVLDLFSDVTCVDRTYPDLDIAYLTELDPTWSDDIVGLILSPEALLFANPITGLACMADAAAANFGLPLDNLFWCMGSWDSAYPLTGASGQDTLIDGALAIAGRMTYKMVRMGLSLDRALDSCAGLITPIWIKSHYRMQPIRPHAMTNGALRIGQTSDLFAFGRTNTLLPGYENWSFLLWRKLACCMGWSPSP